MKEEKMNDEGGSVTAPAPAKASSFVPPTLDEIKSFFNEQHLNGDADQFYCFYSSNGWKVGRNPMKDWRAAARGWSKKEKDFTSKRNAPKDYRKDVPFSAADYKATIF